MSKQQSVFRIRPGLTLAALPVLILLLALGSWQVQRHFAKAAYLTALSSASENQLSVEQWTAGDVQEFARVPANFRGQFYHDSELFIGSATEAGVSGRVLFTTFEAANGDSVWVRRGFVPQNRFDPSSRADGQIAGEVELVGYVRLAGWKGPQWLEPPSDPQRRIFNFPDLPQMNAATGASGRTDFYVDLTAPWPQGSWPRPIDSLAEIPNNHWHYSLTWFALALILCVVYWRLSLSPAQGAANSTKNEDDPS